MSGGHKDLRVYQMAYEVAMEIFHASKMFPKEEVYSLTDQIRRSSRSVAVNIAEGYRKRQYPKMFVSKLADSDAEATEAQVWLDFAKDCGYLPVEKHQELMATYEEVGRMLGSMMAHPEKFVPRSGPRPPLLGFLLTAFCLLLTANCLQAADWPGWRGPLGTGVSTESNLPSKWSATQNVRWKAPLQGAGVSAPVVSGERIFLTTSDSRGSDRLHVHCYRRSDGKELWSTTLFGSAQPEGQFPAGGMAVPTPATDGKHVYALFGTGDLACLDMDGKPVWMRSLAQEYGPFRNRWGMGASPILVGDLLVVLVDHWGESYLLGVDARTGANRWKTRRDASVNWSSPVAAAGNGKTQLIVSGTYQVKGYDAADGAELWHVEGMMMQCIPSPVAEAGVVYAVSGRKGNTLAIRLDGARGDAAKNILWKQNRGTPFVPSAVVYGGHYYLVDDEGFGTCLDLATGAELWRQRLGGRYQASPVAGAGKVYFTNLDGVVSVLKAGAGFELLARNALGETIVASPAVSNGQLFLRGEKHLYCIEEKK